VHTTDDNNDKHSHTLQPHSCSRPPQPATPNPHGGVWTTACGTATARATDIDTSHKQPLSAQGPCTQCHHSRHLPTLLLRSQPVQYEGHRNTRHMGLMIL
jgi:hypothetical protein